MYITKMTKKGQITIPAEYRKKINSKYYSIEIKDNQIIIKPVSSLVGSLKKYTKKNENIEKIMEKEKEIFKEAIIEKHNS
ncbi:AbrB/MazE/SpoVT family DNA-binding domain-containing protein [Hydrogenothermus marinus]|uniref:AbrB family transcriptional regulator n=1 Tax=Hydrogenothermus marinus TaxID=133270 RepID=A0A3M0BSW1_9AQUI|nr:AbrB/MazE/SpoVT family DNA-binding domain-containing protein [Hydrogenothermus marinus]RMA97908.1 AbrB family transcriptional regulator [Hydrogenothermus marinus]